MSKHPVLSAGDLDIVGVIFGLKFTTGCSNGCVELYLEDDENWFYQCTFDSFWLSDLKDVVSRGLER